MKKDWRRKVELLGVAKERDTARCIFCKAPNTTREHLLSGWTHKHLGAPINPGPTSRRVAVRSHDLLETVTYRLPGPLRDWQLKCVCGGDDSTCNNGWMRRLDEAVDPILTPLILGEEKRLFERDHKLIATWAIMKAMVYDHRIIHHMQRKFMFERHEPPHGWAVWLANFDGGDQLSEEWLSTPFSVLRDDVWSRRRSPEWAPNAVAETIILKKVLILVVYSPQHRVIEEWSLNRSPALPFAANIAKIWPPIGHSTKWPMRPLSLKEAYTVSNVFLYAAMLIAGKLGTLRPSVPHKPF